MAVKLLYNLTYSTKLTLPYVITVVYKAKLS